MPDDLTDVGEVITLTLSQDDAVVYRNLLKTLGDVPIDEANRRVFRQGLIAWADAEIQNGSFNA